MLLNLLSYLTFERILVTIVGVTYLLAMWWLWRAGPVLLECKHCYRPYVRSDSDALNSTSWCSLDCELAAIDANGRAADRNREHLATMSQPEDE